ncbi:hypothetical protein TNCV_2592781 [Trichonephila clavipes]|nr:hypothetical protein TNCV_2592781 [Trichonephila clavipes]
MRRVCQHIVPRVLSEGLSADAAKSASQAELKDMATNEFQNCFDDLYKPWQRLSPGTVESFYVYGKECKRMECIEGWWWRWSKRNNQSSEISKSFVNTVKVILLLSKAFGIILWIAVHRKDSTSERRIYTSTELWFPEDGATCNTARATIDLLKDTFGDRLISRFGPVNWPPRSCDLTPLDYFLWGYVKSLIYADKPQTLDHLEDNILHVIAVIRHKCWKKSSKVGRPDWTTSEPAVAV